jgi:hypothetical protein
LIAAQRRCGAREVEQRAERRDEVADRLGREVLVLEHEDEVDDILGLD